METVGHKKYENNKFHKICPVCNRDLILITGQWYKSENSPDGWQSCCAYCSRAAANATHDKNRRENNPAFYYSPEEIWNRVRKKLKESYNSGLSSRLLLQHQRKACKLSDAEHEALAALPLIPPNFHACRGKCGKIYPRLNIFFPLTGRMAKKSGKKYFQFLCRGCKATQQRAKRALAKRAAHQNSLKDETQFQAELADIQAEIKRRRELGIHPPAESHETSLDKKP